MNMARFLKVATLVAGAFAVCVAPAAAQCPGFSQVFGHQLGGAIGNCSDTAQVAGIAYVAGNPTVNSGASNIICEAEAEPTQGANSGCSVTNFDTFEPSTRGDGWVAISGNWGNEGVNGCPNPSGVLGVGRNVMVVRDNKGGTAVISVGYNTDFAGYVTEFADSKDGSYTVSCTDANRTAPTSKCVNISGVNSIANADNTTTATAAATAVVPTIFNDCDPNSVGSDFGSCTEGTLAITAGQIYTAIGACDASALNLSRTAWTLGNSRTFPSTSCMFVGSTVSIGGVEGNAMACAVAVAGAGAATNPRALEVKARQEGGLVRVEFRSETELGLIGFEIETKSGRKIGSLIAPRGAGGGASYVVDVKRGDFKSDKELYVVAVTSTGRNKSDLAAF